jgi:hypothetical protein
MDRVQRMLGVDEGVDAALLLDFGDAMEREGRLAGRLRSVNLHDAAVRQAVDADTASISIGLLDLPSSEG